MVYIRLHVVTLF